jgi:hypothetical protein
LQLIPSADKASTNAAVSLTTAKPLDLARLIRLQRLE